jgi:NAD+ synthase (glutamine-hydrolysing)
MYDGRVDEEVFGATYDFVELYLYYLCCSHATQQRMYNELTPAGKEQFDYFKSHLENLHGYNKHKYLI